MATNLTNLLTSLTGQLRATNKKDEAKLQEYEIRIATALSRQDERSVKSHVDTFEKSDLYRQENLSSEKFRRIKDIARRVAETTEAPAELVYFRSSPVRSPNILGGLPLAATGTRATTLGPYLDISGREIFIDLVKVQKLLEIYIQGQPLPAVLFHAKVVPIRPGQPSPPLSRNYNIVADTFWIRARLLQASAPENLYCGLRVKGGTIQLSAAPFHDHQKITVSPSTVFACSLNLEQKEVTDADDESPYGSDARKASFNLPQQFSFLFSQSSKTIQALSPSSWEVYGGTYNFLFSNNQETVYNSLLSCIAIPIKAQEQTFDIKQNGSPFVTLDGEAKIKSSWWCINAATIDTLAPPEADGNGYFVVECDKGISAALTPLKGGVLSLPNPFFIGEPGRIGITELGAMGAGTSFNFAGWKDEINHFGTSVDIRLRNKSILMVNLLAAGSELVAGLADTSVHADRPVKANGEPVAVHSKNSNYLFWMQKNRRLFSLSDNNLLWDSKLPTENIPKVKPFALAMHNALFTVTPPNSLVLIADLSADLGTMTTGKIYLSFGLFSYLPALPDPYAANLGILKSQFSRSGITNNNRLGETSVWLWLVGMVQWQKQNPANDSVGVSFHFAPLEERLQIEKDNSSAQPGRNVPLTRRHGILDGMTDTPPVNRGDVGSGVSRRNPAGMVVTAAAQNKLQDFALLDVSSKANQMGIAFCQQSNFLQRLVAVTYDVNIQDEENGNVFPILVNGMDVVAEGKRVQSFTLPQVAWEPVFNLTPKSVDGDPPYGFNYYTTDGVATRLGNLSRQWVPLSPIPMAKYLVETYKSRDDERTYAMFNLPFGMVAISMLNNKSAQLSKPVIDNVRPVFDNYINGGIQLELTAGTSPGSAGEGNLFEGYTAQYYNINNADGTSANASTLANSPTIIFNNEFLTNSSNLPGRPAVPLNRIGISGYGANAFSNWQNKDAQFAQVSQALFNITTGRTSHEVVQVKSMVYPWGIRVVRTITLFRLANGYVMRIDSGWQAESDGKFDFSYKDSANNMVPNPYEIYPGIVHGLFSIKNIQEVPKTFNQGATLLQALTFDADVQLENVVEGGSNNRVPARKIYGYVQLAPAGQPIPVQDFAALLAYEGNTIGGPISCAIKVAGTHQRMILDRFDVNNSINTGGTPVFVAATRGSVILPKDGSWSIVQHTRGTGEVTPLPEQLSIPLIRAGKWHPVHVVPPSAAAELVRLAYPGDLLRTPDAATINFGFLQNLNSQKVLFLTPSFKPGLSSLLSKTPPLLADSFRLLGSNGIFPNIGNAETAFGTAIQLLKGVGEGELPIGNVFKTVGSVTDTGKQVFELMTVQAAESAGKLVDQGYKLIKDKANNVLNDVIKFDLPAFEHPLVDLPGQLKIYIEYKATSSANGKNYIGKYNFDVHSFANDLTNTWKGRMSNLAMVVDLGPFIRLMTIKGNFNAQKGKETDFGSNEGDVLKNLPLPEIEFSEAVEPVIQILEILSALSTGNYADALKKGLKVAMSNNANIWEYKFEATKDIPLVRFPPEANLYNSPQTPLKLEASLAIGVYFNAALKVTSDPKKLLPTAGAFFAFHGGLQVMCVSVGVGTIYAVGSADLMLEANTSPLIALTMKFGFGAQVGVGLPVIGNVSILFMVGVEIYVDSTKTVVVTAFLLFRGHAEILGGIVGVTITIEAKGSVEKIGNGPTNCKASVTFALDISIFLVINISFSESWEETRQIA